MSPSQVVDQAKAKFSQSAGHFQEELKKVRTGRAHPTMLDGVAVDAYGVQMPLIQVGTVTAPEAQLLQITPFDQNNIAAITSAIRDNPSLDMNPSDDGRVIRIPVPPLTEERRREYVKLVGSKVEDCMVSLRNARHEALRTLEQARKDKDMGEDEAKRYEKQVDDELNKTRADVEAAARAKEQDIMSL